MSSVLSRKGTECCRRTWKPHSTTFRTCNDQKTRHEIHKHTMVTLAATMMSALLPGDAHTQDDQYFLLKPHPTTSATTTLSLRWQSTSVPVLVRCLVEHPQYILLSVSGMSLLTSLVISYSCFISLFNTVVSIGFHVSIYEDDNFKVLVVLTAGLCCGLSEFYFIYPQVHLNKTIESK